MTARARIQRSSSEEVLALSVGDGLLAVPLRCIGENLHPLIRRARAGGEVAVEPWEVGALSVAWRSYASA